jgi:hypothetical protein
MNSEEKEGVAKLAKDQMEIITAAGDRLQELAASAGSGRFPDETSKNTVCNLTSKVAELATRHADDKNSAEHHAFAAKAHDLAEHARSLAGEIDSPDSVRRYHGNTSANHFRVAQALGYRVPSPTIHSTTVGGNNDD